MHEPTTDFRTSMTAVSQLGTGASKSFTPYDSPRCVVCAARLSVHERVTGQVCRRRSCRDQYLRQRLQQEHLQEQRLRSSVRKLRDRAVRASRDHGKPLPQDTPIAIVPANDRRLANLPERRRRRFRDRLMQIISQAFSRPIKRTDGLASNATHDPLAGISSSACALCRGQCCWQGQDHAFIHVETIHRYRLAHAAERPRHVLDAYLSRLGNKVFRDSCVYHGVDGCELPREMRSRICNDFLCRRLQDVRTLSGDQGHAQVFAAAAIEQRVLRTALLGRS